MADEVTITPTAAGPGERCRLPLALHADRPVCAALVFTRLALAEWRPFAAAPGRSERIADDVLLVVAELVSNAHRHGHGAREVILQHRPGLVGIAVSDHSPVPPVRRATAGRETGGHYGMVVGPRLPAGEHPDVVTGRPSVLRVLYRVRGHGPGAAASRSTNGGISAGGTAWGGTRPP